MARNGIHCSNRLNDGNPTGGSVSGQGIGIVWQDGPLGAGADRKAPNGAFVEDVIEAARQRLEFLNDSPFQCAENAAAINHLALALQHLHARTSRRTAAGTEGTYQVDVDAEKGA